MGIKKFDIDWEGKRETIEYEDDITFGELENILNKCMDLSKVNDPKVNIPLYRQLITTTVITKAPFQIKDITTIRNLKASVAKQLMVEVMKTYPLLKYLEEWVETFTGESLDISQASIISSQENLDGQKIK